VFEALIYGPFLDSGMSLIAAETCQHGCLGMEPDPAYCDVAMRRWQTLTGETAVHAFTGLPFDSLDEELQPEERCWSV
jgi:DNA modification methylase